MKITVDLKGVQQMFQINETAGQRMLDDAYIFFKDKTPIGNPAHWKSKPPVGYTPGNARRNTIKDNERKTITANYPYAERLDQEGWSKQAPDGMSQPTITYIRQRLSRYIKGK